LVLEIRYIEKPIGSKKCVSGYACRDNSISSVLIISYARSVGLTEYRIPTKTEC
jgi:hypothetical protein